MRYHKARRTSYECTQLYLLLGIILVLNLSIVRTVVTFDMRRRRPILFTNKQSRYRYSCVHRVPGTAVKLTTKSPAR
eukprot:SAG31_NODE_12551_length_933_cov_1.148681_1_plen_76_part_10